MRRLFAALALSTMLAAPALAENRALLIGVGAFQSPDVSALPGIDKDIAMMADLAKRMGVAAPTRLLDKDATRANILAAMRRTLTEGVGADDVVLIYYSGHGTQVKDSDGDEDDGGDEVIVAHDAAFGETSVRGVISDDEIAALLKLSPSRNIMLVVDACNSGTIDRAGPLPGSFQGERNGVPKFIRYPGMPAGGPKPFVAGKGFGVSERKTADEPSYVSMSAASDVQSAIATQTGSVFTVGITRAVAGKSANGAITPRDMMEGARRYIKEQGMAQSPEIHGSPQLAERPLPLSNVAGGEGPNWSRVRALAAKMTPTQISGLKPRYLEGEKLVFDIEVPVAGYLNVIDVGPDDNITLLYPNRYSTANQVPAGRFTVPGSALPFDLPAQAPYGKSLLVAIVTSEPMSLLASSADGKTATLATPSLAGLENAGVVATRSFGVSARPEAGAAPRGAWAAAVETEVCSRDGRCR